MKTCYVCGATWDDNCKAVDGQMYECPRPDSPRSGPNELDARREREEWEAEAYADWPQTEVMPRIRVLKKPNLGLCLIVAGAVFLSALALGCKASLYFI